MSPSGIFSTYESVYVDLYFYEKKKKNVSESVTKKKKKMKGKTLHNTMSYACCSLPATTSATFSDGRDRQEEVKKKISHDL